MEFKTIKQFPNYEIYEDGTIWRMEHDSFGGSHLTRRKIKANKSKNGYLTVSMRDNKGRKRQMYVHRLVYMAFIGDIPPKHEIDHIDGDRANNSPSNLRQCTHKANCNNLQSIARYKAANALDKGKFNREKMMAARSEQREEELRELYIIMYRKNGSVQLYDFIKKGHCNYYRACRIIGQMQDFQKNLGVS